MYAIDVFIWNPAPLPKSVDDEDVTEVEQRELLPLPQPLRWMCTSKPQWIPMRESLRDGTWIRWQEASYSSNQFIIIRFQETAIPVLATSNSPPIRDTLSSPIFRCFDPVMMSRSVHVFLTSVLSFCRCVLGKYVTAILNYITNRENLFCHSHTHIKVRIAT